MRVSELSEQAYSASICNNSLAREELALVYRRLQRDPYSVGTPAGLAHDYLDFRIYETPRLTKRPRLRMLFTVDGWERIVVIEALRLR